MINKQELEWAIAKKAGCKKYEAENFLNAFKEVIKDYLVAGETVNVRNFFRVSVKQFNGRIRRTFSKEEILVPPYKKVKFKESKALENEVMKRIAERDTDEKTDDTELRS